MQNIVLSRFFATCFNFLKALNERDVGGIPYPEITKAKTTHICKIFGQLITDHLSFVDDLVYWISCTDRCDVVNLQVVDDIRHGDALLHGKFEGMVLRAYEICNVAHCGVRQV